MKEHADTAEGRARAELDLVVSDVVRVRRMINSLQAHEAHLLHESGYIAGVLQEGNDSGRYGSDLGHRTVAAELGAALRVSDRAVQRMMSDADTLVTAFPATFTAMSTGRISRAHAAVIVDAGAHITDETVRADYEASAVGFAVDESASRLRPYAQLLGERLHPRALAERHAEAAADRAVRVIDLTDGMAELIATLPATLAHAALDRLSQLARTVKKAIRDDEAAAVEAAGAGASGADAASPVGTAVDCAKAATPPPGRDTRSMDALRADILTDLLLAGRPEAHRGGTDLSAVHARVQVTVPVLALLGDDAEPAALTGYGPIDPATARRLAGDATEWDRILTHPISGAVLAVDRYRPSEDLKRTLRARDQHCRFPGCRLALWKCDIDHTYDAAGGGATEIGNLAHLCRRHHVLKHTTAWAVTQKPGGILEWTSPTGRIYPDVPVSRVMFRASGDPPPPDPHHAGLLRASGDPPPF